MDKEASMVSYWSMKMTEVFSVGILSFLVVLGLGTRVYGQSL